MNKNWTKYEVEKIVHCYFQMLVHELSGKKYNKAAFRRELKPALNNRSDGSIEFKHQNISAVLLKYGMPYIIGYKPFGNYQKLLEDEVLNFISSNPQLDVIFEKFSSTFQMNEKVDGTRFEKWEESSPDPNTVKSKTLEHHPRVRKLNYIEKEQRNQKLGMAGEQLAFEYEKWRLIKMGKEKFINKIEWVSKIHGDGAGYDIQSVNKDGSERYIEVKTTKLGKDAPIFFSKNELRFSQTNISTFFLYRIFEFGKNPKLFIKNGNLSTMCQVEPTNFIGRF